MKKYIVLIFGFGLIGCTTQDWQTIGAIMRASSNQKTVETVSSDAIFPSTPARDERVTYRRDRNTIYGSDGSVCTIDRNNMYCHYR